MKRTRARTRIQLAAGLLSVVLLAAGCSGTGASPAGSGAGTAAELRVGDVGLDVSNIDPARGMALEVNSYVQEFLMKLTPTGEVEPNLAASVEQTDDLTYVYTLRDDVKFSNGEPLTADDVVASLNYERNPEFSE